MRRAFVLILLLSSASAMAQAQRPPKLEPLPEPPPPPAIPGPDDPAVRIPVQKGDKVEEARQDGRVVAVKVTPPGGAPYYLVDVTGTGQWVRRDALDPDFRVPMWVIRTFD